ncbi:MAG: M28 family peptidase [Candidatus Freyarchaeota archaeon]
MRKAGFLACLLIGVFAFGFIFGVAPVASSFTGTGQLVAYTNLVQLTTPADENTQPTVSSCCCTPLLHCFKPKIPTTEEIFGWITDIAAMGYRIPGSDVDHQAEDYIMQKFIEFGLKDVHKEPIPITFWQAQTWKLTVAGQEIPCFYIPYTNVTVTGPSGMTKQMVYLHDGTPEDFESTNVTDKIVLVDIHFADLQVSLLEYFSYFFYDPNNTIPPGYSHPAVWIRTNFDAYYRAVENGAAGFVGVLVDYPVTKEFTYWAPYDGVLKPIPGLWLNRETGDLVKSLIPEGGSVEANLVLTGIMDENGVTNNIVGVLPGKTDDIILVHSHHDGPFYAAVEDASGTSIVLAMAKYLAQFPKCLREKTIVFLSTAGHFYGGIGQKAFIEEHKDDWIPKTIVDVCLEHIALETLEVADGEWALTGYPEPRGIFTYGNPLLISFAKRAIINNNLERTLIIQTNSPLGVPTDAGHFHEYGIPVYSFISGPMYLFDIGDTPDKVAKDQLVPVTKAFSEMVMSVDKVPASLIRDDSPPVPPPLPPIPPIPPYPGMGDVFTGFGRMKGDGLYHGKGGLYIRPAYIDVPTAMIYIGIDGSKWIGWKIVDQCEYPNMKIYKCEGDLGKLYVHIIHGEYALAIGQGIYFFGFLV